MIAPINLPPDYVRKVAIPARHAGLPRDQFENFVPRGAYIPLPWALEFHALAREADQEGGPDEIGIGGSRGPGKSHAIFAQLALDDCQRFPGIKALYLRKIAKQAREQLEDLRNKVLRNTPHEFNRNEGIIRFPNGSRIIVGHFKNDSDIDQYLGLEYEIVAIEEATTLTIAKYRAIRDSNRSSVPGVRPRIYNSTNPGGVGHGWYKKKFILPFRKGQEITTRFIPATVEDNRYIDAGYRAKLEENTGWRLRAYRYGDWDIAAGQFFSTWRQSVHVIPPKAIPNDWEVWLSMDYGFVHYTVVHLWAKSHDGIVYTLDEYAARRTPIEINAQGIREMLVRNRIRPSRIRRFVAGSDVFTKDANGVSIADQYKAEGFRLARAQMDRVNGWAAMLQGLGDITEDRTDKIFPTWFVCETCTGLIETMPLLEHNPNRPEDIKKWDVDEDGNGGDDYADSGRYGYMEAYRRKQAQAVAVDWRAGTVGPGEDHGAIYENSLKSDEEISALLDEASYD